MTVSRNYRIFYTALAYFYNLRLREPTVVRGIAEVWAHIIITARLRKRLCQLDAKWCSSCRVVPSQRSKIVFEVGSCGIQKKVETQQTFIRENGGP
jgi:hypothetical protein